MTTRSLAPRAALLLALAGCAPPADPPAPGPTRSGSEAAPPNVSSDEAGLAATIRSLESMGNRSTHEKQWEAARWIADRLIALGLEAEVRAYEHEGRSWPNVTASLRGTAVPEELVLVIAHLDSISVETPSEAPGADDDGSGVAVLLDVARRLAARPLARTVEFVVFSNEERGQAGSRHFARAARASGARIQAVLNLETLGHPAPASPVDLAGLRSIGATWQAVGALRRMLANYVKTLLHPAEPVEVVGRPAHSSLVRRVASSVRPHVEVREVVKQDCG